MKMVHYLRDTIFLTVNVSLVESRDRSRAVHPWTCSCVAFNRQRRSQTQDCSPAARWMTRQARLIADSDNGKKNEDSTCKVFFILNIEQHRKLASPGKTGPT